MPTRCRNYNADGTPIREGCPRGAGCHYPHPGSSAWDSATGYIHSRGSRGGRGWGRGRGRGAPSDSSASWGAPPPLPAKVSSVWDTSSWGPTSPSTTQHSTSENGIWDGSRGRQASTCTQRKETILWDPTTSSNDPSASLWGGASSSQKEQEKMSDSWGWGSNADQGTSGWGNEGNGWGSNDRVDARAVPVAWGVASPPTPKASSEEKSVSRAEKPMGKTSDSRGWGSDANQGTSGWGNEGNGWGSNDRVDARAVPVAWGVASPPTPKASSEEKSVSRTGELVGKIAKPRKPEEDKGTGATNARAVETFSKGMKPIPLPGRKPIRQEGSPPVSPPAVIFDKAPTMKLNLNIQTDSLGVPNAMSSSVPDSACSTYRRDTAFPRNQSFQNTIRYLQSAVRLQLELDAAKKADEDWKRTQSSSQYSRASLSVRIKFDKLRATYKQEENRIKKRLDEAIKILSESPHLSESSKPLPEVDIQQLMLYTSQLKDWLKELEAFTQWKSPTPFEAPPDTLREAWKNIKDSMAAVEEISERITEQTAEFKNTILRDFIDSKAKTLLDVHNATDTRMMADSYESLLSEANQLGQSLTAQVEPVADLIGTSHGDQKELEHLKAQLVEELNVQEQIKLSFKQFDEWRQEDAARIQQMKKQLQSLHELPRPVPPPANLEELLPEIRRMVVDNLEKEVAVLIDQLRAACEKNSDVFVSEIYNNLQPTLDLTDALCTRAREAVNARKA